MQKLIFMPKGIKEEGNMIIVDTSLVLNIQLSLKLFGIIFTLSNNEPTAGFQMAAD